MFEQARQLVSSARKDERGAFGVSTVVSFFVIAFVGAILIPLGITQLTNADTTGWAANVISIWTVVPVIVIVGVLFIFLRQGGLTK